jgi:hypothetical protein
MATLVLQAAGAAIGGIFGPVGAIIGRALGGLAGYAVDQSLFGSSRTIVGGRLADLDVQASREGTSIPRVYGRVRIAGQMIWATRFEETVSDDREGGKGSGGTTTVRTYSYFANFAIGLCEGPITRIGRVWADGKPFDLSSVTCRIHTGTDDQEADSLILAKQGEGAPAYRGTAYVVFERMPLEDFGNRIPQLSFEVLRAVGGVEDKVRSITLIPGSTEFGYDPEAVRQEINPGETRTVNRHVDSTATDWHAALDDLQAVCPNLESVGLVVSWFGDDLRAGACTLKPGVADGEGETTPEWSAAGLSRSEARVVSRFEGKPAYGGTPSDASVVRAIRDLTDRGVKVMFLPFVMMDVPGGNGLPDPYGGASQGAYPWRGMLTASVAPGLPGSPDKTAAAAAEIAAFVGSAAPDDFEVTGDAVVYSGPDEWSLRRLVLHNAWLCKAAGGVDAFLLGSELRGLTTLRSSASHYPFVAALVALAEDVRAVLGPSTKISYAADWSEYFGHQPRDGSGDVFFHLDPLWANDAIDFVGIDNYMPLADWRDGDDHLDAALFDSIRERAHLRANIAAGEGYDWYYASFANREAQVRTAIADGAYGKPWVFRYKDLVGWWSNAHHSRPGGVESVAATDWVPQSKPIRFTEMGCPAVDKGPNQPNVFPDPKSAAGAIPYFSTALRDDLVQRRFLEATLGYWDPDDPDFDPAGNPVSGIYDGRMVDHAATHLWTWDARPFPVFPYHEDLWSDGPNWDTGHWLNGRLGALSADALVAVIAADYGVAEADVGDLDGVIDGYLIPQVTSARRALEPLAEILMFDAVESGSAIRFLRRGRRSRMSFGGEDLAEEGDRPLVSIRRAQETELPAELSIGFADTLADYRPTSVSSRRLATGSHRTDATETGATLTHSVATGLADTLLQDVWAGRETISFALTGKALSLEPADICDLDLADGSRIILVTRIEDAGFRRVEARTIEPDILAPVPSSPRIVDPQVPATLSAPEIILLDLPLLTGSEPGYALRVGLCRTLAGSRGYRHRYPRNRLSGAPGPAAARDRRRTDGAARVRSPWAMGPRQRDRGPALCPRAGERAPSCRAERRQCRGHRLSGHRLRSCAVRDGNTGRRSAVAASGAASRASGNDGHRGCRTCQRREFRYARRRRAASSGERNGVMARPDPSLRKNGRDLRPGSLHGLAPRGCAPGAALPAAGPSSRCPRRLRQRIIFVDSADADRRRSMGAGRGADRRNGGGLHRRGPRWRERRSHSRHGNGDGNLFRRRPDRRLRQRAIRIPLPHHPGEPDRGAGRPHGGTATCLTARI